MAIKFKNNKFHLYNNKMSYVIEISRQDDLLNLYYGARIDAEDIDISLRMCDFACYSIDNLYSLSALPQEYPSAGAFDFRSPAYEIETDKGLHTPELKYKSHKIIGGKPPIKGLPAVYTENDSEAQTLIITTSDETHGIEVKLYLCLTTAGSESAIMTIHHSATGLKIKKSSVELLPSLQRK